MTKGFDRNEQTFETAYGKQSDSTSYSKITQRKPRNVQYPHIRFYAATARYSQTTAKSRQNLSPGGTAILHKLSLSAVRSCPTLRPCRSRYSRRYCYSNQAICLYHSIAAFSLGMLCSSSRCIHRMH